LGFAPCLKLGGGVEEVEKKIPAKAKGLVFLRGIGETGI